MAYFFTVNLSFQSLFEDFYVSWNGSCTLISWSFVPNATVDAFLSLNEPYHISQREIVLNFVWSNPRGLKDL